MQDTFNSNPLINVHLLAPLSTNIPGIATDSVSSQISTKI